MAPSIRLRSTAWYQFFVDPFRTMATIGRVNGASFNNTPRLSYIATAAFNTFFYSYSTSLNASLVTVGTLAAVTGATAGNCPAGRVLRENGRKLYPGANPGITTYLVGVYDAQTLLSGFIDPNAAVFQIYNTDKPTYLSDGVEPTANTTDQGPSVFTRGKVTAIGDIISTGGSVTAIGDIISTGGQIRSSTVTALTAISANGAATAQEINSALGQVFTITAAPPSGVASITLDHTATQTAGSIFSLIISATTVQNTTFTFGANIVSAGTLITTAAAGPATRFFTISFVSDGTTFYETSRTAAQA